MRGREYLVGIFGPHLIIIDSIYKFQPVKLMMAAKHQSQLEITQSLVPTEILQEKWVLTFQNLVICYKCSLSSKSGKAALTRITASIGLIVKLSRNIHPVKKANIDGATGLPLFLQMKERLLTSKSQRP